MTRRSRGATRGGTGNHPEPLAGDGEDNPLVPLGGLWQRISSTQPLVVDSAITLLLIALTTAGLLHRNENTTPATWLISFGLLLPLAARRRSPSVVFGVISAVALVQWIADERVATDFALLIALYTVAAHEPRRRAIVAAGVLEVGVVLASLRFAPAGEDVLGSMVFLSGLVAAALFIGTTMRTRRAYLASLLDRAVRLERERDQQARLAATAERTRIARDLHDIVAHGLSVIVALADGAAVANTSDPAQATSAMREVSATGRQALTEMQRLVGVLRDDDDAASRAPQPDLTQLDELVNRSREAGLPVRLTVVGPARRLSPTQETVAYRVVQEALTNVFKHATEVGQVSVRMTWSAHQLEIDIRNDGRAAAPFAGATAGHGLAGMNERLALFGGSLAVGPAAGGGWQVRARLPLDQVEEGR